MPATWTSHQPRTSNDQLGKGEDGDGGLPRIRHEDRSYICRQHLRFYKFKIYAPLRPGQEQARPAVRDRPDCHSPYVRVTCHGLCQPFPLPRKYGPLLCNQSWDDHRFRSPSFAWGGEETTLRDQVIKQVGDTIFPMLNQTYTKLKISKGCWGSDMRTDVIFVVSISINFDTILDFWGMQKIKV